MIGSLYFEKISKFDRAAEPVTVSIPFARGKLTDLRQLVIRDGTSVAPAQARALAHWEDGSVKWLLVHCQPDLPGNLDKTLLFDIAEEPVEVEPPARVTLTETSAGVQVNTGPLAFLIPSEGFWPVQEVVLRGQPLFGAAPFKGLALCYDGQWVDSATGPVTLEVEEAGPLRAVVLISGKHRKADGSGYLDLRGRITAYAGKPYIEMEHQFIHAEEEGELSLQELKLEFRPQAEGAPQLALGEGYYQTRIQQSQDSVEMILDTETMLYESNEHFIDCFYGDFWVDWRDARGGVTLSIHQSHQNFPKKLRATAQGITCWLYPGESPSAPLLQGMAKTHRIGLHFHAPDVPIEACSARSLQFQLPDRPSLPRAWFRENNPWRETFFPEKLPDRLITFYSALHDGRPKALGMFHFGDAPDAGYTDQGRGRGHTVWVNNEYDRPHTCTLYYGLTGQRRVLDSAIVAARHWLDVDLCHYSPDPLLHGGLKIHTRYHVTGGVTPSHEWTEGLLDYYFMTGRREALEGALSVGENIMRHMAQPRMKTPGEASVREGGWALRAMVGLYLGTGEERWRIEAKRLVDMYLDWYEKYGALLAPYTSHSMPRVTFMISLTVNSFSRYLLIEDDARIRKLIVETVDDLIAHCLGPDGVAYYKELPSLRTTASDPNFVEALTHAYRVTGDEKYLKIATRQFASLVSGLRGGGTQATPKHPDDSGAVISGHGGGRVFDDRYICILLYAGAATPLGLLDWYEYPF